MALRRYPGSIIRATALSPTSTSASGVWTLNEVMNNLAGSRWPVGGNDSFVKLLLHCDGTNGSTTFTDSSATGRTITAVGNAQISTAQAKFDQSGLFDGTGDHLTAPSSTDWDLRSTDSTMDCWVYPVSLTAPSTVRVIMGTAISGQYMVYVYANGSIAVGINGTNEIASAAGAITTGSWQNIEVGRVNSTGRTDIYVNGTSVANATTNWTVDPSTNTFKVGGGTGTSNQDWNGYIDEVRVSKGICRHTANFTPRAQPYF